MAELGDIETGYLGKEMLENQQKEHVHGFNMSTYNSTISFW
jgi:hypothetical protein